MSSKEVEKLVRKEQIEELYNIGQELGRGKFAIVKRCTEKSSGEQFAAKYLRKRRGGKSCRDDIMVEIDIMRQAMNHHRIVKIREVFESNREMIIIIELATGGELFRMIAVDPLPEDKAKYIVWELLEGVQHLHQLNIVHLDLKPENILLYRKGQLDIKIADFGLALQISPGQQVRTLVGTAEYVAPEILNFEPISIMADMWSIGALTYALLTGYSPFQGETHNDTFYNVSICEYDFEDEVFDNVSQHAKDFIEELLQKKPSARLTPTQCLQHPWMQSITATPPIQNPQTQIHEGLNSSTSSLDSALCPSSLEQSPISSASSSFAPRPAGKGSDEDVPKQEDMTQVISKLCTERQKAGNDSGLLINSTLDGSESSISSNESCCTLKPDEEDGGSVVPKPPSPLPSALPTAHKSSESASSSSSVVDSDARSISRPSSGLRVATPIPSDVVSLKPETVEQLKKLERLKQRKLKENDKDIGSNGSTDKRFSSSPVTSTLSKLKIGSFKLKTRAEKYEDEESIRRSRSPNILLRSQESPVPAHEKQSPDVKEGSVPNTKKSPIFKSKESPVLKSKESPILKSKESPVLKSKEGPILKTAESPVQSAKKSLVCDAKDKLEASTENAIKTTSNSDGNNNSSSVDESKPNNTHTHDRHSPAPSGSSKSPVLPETSLSKLRSISPKPEQSSSSPFVNRSNIENMCLPNSSPASSESSFNNNTSSTSPLLASPTLPVFNNRSKSFSPQTVSRPPLSNRHTKSTSPSSNTSIMLRNKAMKKQTKESWRKTPHIDADAIEAILNGDIDENLLESANVLETCTEEVEPRSKSPQTDKQLKNNHLRVADEISPILKKGGHSDTDVVRRNVVKKKTVVVVPQRTKHQSIYFGSPDHSPGPQDLSHTHLKTSSLRRSLTMSQSSPDLTTITGSKSRTKKPKREDTYVTGSGTPKESNRRSFFGGGASLTRSLTISGKGSKKSAHVIREKYKLRNKDC